MKNLLVPFSISLVLTHYSCGQNLKALAKDVQIKVPTQIGVQTTQ